MNVEAESNGVGAIDWTRVVGVWRSTAPSDEDIRGARRRFALRAVRKPRSALKALLFALAQGFAVGVVTLATAALIAERTRIASDTHSGEPEFVKKRIAPALGSKEHAVEPHALPPPDIVPSPVPAAHFETDDARPNVVSPRGASAPSSAGAPKALTSGTAPAKAQDTTTSVVALPALGSDASWKRVAEALDTNDWTRADRALTELVTRGDAHTRDAAALARAELRMAHGGAVERSALERLANGGKTPLIRHRAAELLDRLEHSGR